MKGQIALVASIVLVIVAVLLLRARPAPTPEPVAFVAVQPALFGASGSLTDAWADIDGDGDPDRLVGFNGAPVRLYRNDGVAGFVDVATDAGLSISRRVRTAAWGDFDADGDPDLLLGFAGDGPVTALYRNDGAGGFANVTAETGLMIADGVTRQASWIDYDGDGDLDLFLAMRDGPNRLFENDGGAEPDFSDVTVESGIGDPRRSVGAAWFDFDRDGDLDVVVANMDGDANGLWRNDGGAFTDVATGTLLAAGGRGLADEALGSVRPCIADVNDDGLLDVFFANYGPNELLLAGRQGGWISDGSRVGLAIDSRFDTCTWGDFDHDGSLDLFVNGTITGGEQFRDWLLRRESGSVFVDVTPPELLAIQADHGATWVDFDQDGDLDLALTGVSDDGTHDLMRNLLRPEFARHSLAVSVVDSDGHATRAGAEVRLFAAGTDRLLGTRLVDTGSGYDAQSELPVHFGLPGAQPVDVEVILPFGGTRRRERVENVDPAAYRGSVLVVRVGSGGSE